MDETIDKSMLLKAMNKWIKQIKTYKDRINNLTPTDRLSYLSAIYECHNYMRVSINGWIKWFTNPSIMDNFKQEELESLLKEFILVGNDIFDLDIAWSEKGTDIWKEEIVKDTRKDILDYVR